MSFGSFLQSAESKSWMSGPCSAFCTEKPVCEKARSLNFWCNCGNAQSVTDGELAGVDLPACDDKHMTLGL